MAGETQRGNERDEASWQLSQRVIVTSDEVRWGAADARTAGIKNGMWDKSRKERGRKVV
jgi:hypothetical protein